MLVVVSPAAASPEAKPKDVDAAAAAGLSLLDEPGDVVPGVDVGKFNLQTDAIGDESLTMKLAQISKRKNFLGTVYVCAEHSLRAWDFIP